MKGKTISQIKTGDFAEFSKTISESDIYTFAGVTGDLNPAHINEDYAKDTFFKGRIAHGMLLAGFISAVIGMKLPGPGTIYIKQEIAFKGPAKIGDTITARAEAIEINEEKNRVRLQTTCRNQDGKLLVDGEALISPPKA
ncbi:MAG: MaoC domain containing protein dehydratase [Candidatus Magnetoglobus multicellularis str. Araruama]|uniref:MaoC domain containing protein dehydratase n=1 Tax=Candidatus Magnetoglobus multicellularis str. Araruama TaxID=890399 RepID=A0A1V1PIQ7_9BACT|nr:MAG: MaoC domain containing protein dehydratase [Candidatus Magnetoglobus multicellularis str. Araruama]